MTRAGRHKKKHPYRNIDFSSKKRRAPTSEEQAAERQRLIDEFIATKGVTKVAPIYAPWDSEPALPPPPPPTDAPDSST